MTRVVIACSGDNTGLNFTRSLRLAGGYEVIGVDYTLDDYHNSIADERYLLSADGLFAPALSSIARAHQADLLYVADTGAVLDEVADQRASIGVTTFLPDQAELLLTEDKWSTYVRLAEHGLPVPDTVLVEHPEDLNALASRHEALWLRRRRGSGGRGALATTNLSLARVWIESCDGWGDFTAAEQLTERTATFSGLWWQGSLVMSQLRERLGWKYAARSPSGVTGITGSQRTVWDAELHELSVAAITQVAPKAHGAFGVDFTFDRVGSPRITEIQPARFYSSIHFLAAVGANFPDLYCRLATTGRVAYQPTVNPIRDNVYWVKAVDREPQIMSEDLYLRALDDV